MAEFKTANGPLLEKYDWQDQAKGFVRIPIDQAKEIVLQEWAGPRRRPFKYDGAPPQSIRPGPQSAGKEE